MNIMKSKKEYVYYYKNPEKAKEYNNFMEPYYNLNFPFPNVNMMFYNENKEDYWLEKIKKMYYYYETKNKSSDEILIEKIQKDYGQYIYNKYESYINIDKFWYDMILFDDNINHIKMIK